MTTAKLNGVDPQTYLNDVLGRIVSGRTKSHQLYELRELEGRTRAGRTDRRTSSRRHTPLASMSRAAVPLYERLRGRTDRRRAATNLSMLDGYVAAIVAGPVSFDPRAWICPLLAIGAGAFNHGGTPEFAAISTAAVTRAGQRSDFPKVRGSFLDLVLSVHRLSPGVP